MRAPKSACEAAVGAHRPADLPAPIQAHHAHARVHTHTPHLPIPPTHTHHTHLPQTHTPPPPPPHPRIGAARSLDRQFTALQREAAAASGDDAGGGAAGAAASAPRGAAAVAAGGLENFQQDPETGKWRPVSEGVSAKGVVKAMTRAEADALNRA